MIDWIKLANGLPVKRIQSCLILITALTLPLVGSTALAQRTPNNSGLNQAIHSVEQRTGGQVLSAEKRRINGQIKYRIKILTPSGLVRIILIDAR